METEAPKFGMENRQLEKLIEANEKLAKIESLEKLVPTLLTIARDIAEAEAASFMTYDPKDRVLRFTNIEDEAMGNAVKKTLKNTFAIPLGKGIAGQAGEEKCAILIEDAQHCPQFFGGVDNSTGFITRSIIAVPVIYKEELLGVIEAINARGKPFFDNADKEILVCLSNLVAVAIIRNRLLEERLKQQAIQIQMETATKIQSLFRPKLPYLGRGGHVWATSKAARFVGGDLYDIIPMPNESWLIYVADVSDKGLPAALIMAAVWYRIRSQAHYYEDLCSLLEALNYTLYNLLSKEGYFVTIFIGRFWPQTGKFEFVNGGHLPAVKIQTDGYDLIAGKKGVALGIIDKCQYHASTATVSPGESLLIMTDGISEAMNLQHECFGNQRIFQCIKNSERPPYGKGLIHCIREWQKNSVQNDDITLLEIWKE